MSLMAFTGVGSALGAWFMIQESDWDLRLVDSLINFVGVCGGLGFAAGLFWLKMASRIDE